MWWDGMAACLTSPHLFARPQALPKPVIITAFDLICGAAGLDLNALFQKRGDVVMRQTRFVSMCAPETNPPARRRGPPAAYRPAARLRLSDPRHPRTPARVIAGPPLM